MTASVARIFLSSTFRDFGEERELLTKRVFPALRARLRERFVELVDVDLRWGITPEAAERGEVLPICLAEIDRSRPWFIGMLGERYGWVPPIEKYDPTLVEQRPWLAEHQGGKSVTELEILHGVLNDPKMAGRAFFYFRTPSYARKKGGDYVSISSEDETKLADLKDRIRTSGFPVIENYPNPDALAKRLEADLWEVLNEAYPQADVPDAFTREQQQHEAYALPRRRLYLGGDRYLISLDEVVASGQQRILIDGHSGGGKSALIANWLERRRHAFPAEQAHEYYLGASANAATPTNLVRHLIERIRRTTGSQDDIPAEPQALFDSLPTWLADASVHAGKENYRWIITLDGLNNLTDLRDLRWLPEFLPDRVHLIISCLQGAVRESLVAKGAWQEIDVLPLTPEDQGQLLRTYLGRYNKALEVGHEARVLAHPLAANPLFLRTLAEELRLFGSHEDLSDELDRYLSSLTVDDLFERVLERVEQDCGAPRVKAALTGIWASRAGLAEEELLAYAGLVPATWAPIRLALDEALLESGGRLNFAHDYMRIAVSDRYLAGNNELDDENQSPQALTLRRKAHEKLARWFAAHAFPGQAPGDGTAAEGFAINAARATEEIPYQWWAAKNWRQLKKCLIGREMCDAILEHRNGEDLLGLWLDIEANTRAKLERAYQTTWKQWNLDATAEETGDLASALAEFLREAGRYRHPLARRLADLALAIAEKSLGAEDPITGERFDKLAQMLRDQGDYTEAEPLFRGALAIAEKTRGKNHTDTGSLLTDLAGLLYMMGNYVGAETYTRRALAIAEKGHTPEHPETGRCLNNLALILHHNGDYAGAEALCRRALYIAENTKGPHHPDSGARINNLANIMKSSGDYVEAKLLYRKALAIAEKAQGPEHPVTGTRLNNLALLMRNKGDDAGAEPLLRRALAIVEKAKGPDHPDTGVRLNNLANLLKKMGAYAEAELLYRRALAITERGLGPNHPDTGLRLNNLGSVLQARGDYANAEPMYRRAVEIAEMVHGKKHSVTALRLSNLGLLMRDKGDIRSAESFCRRALDIDVKVRGPEHQITGYRLYNLGNILLFKGDCSGAESLLQKALFIAEKNSAVVTQVLESPLRIEDALYALGEVCISNGQKSRALEFYNRGLKVLRSREEISEARINQFIQRIVEVDAD